MRQAGRDSALYETDASAGRPDVLHLLCIADMFHVTARMHCQTSHIYALCNRHALRLAQPRAMHCGKFL